MFLKYGDTSHFIKYLVTAFLCVSLYTVSHLGIIFDNIYIAITGIVGAYIIILGFLVKEKFFF